MSPVISSRNVLGPAVVACLTGFADRMGESLGKRLARGGASASIRILGSTDDPSTRVAQALIEVQDIRLSGGAAVRPRVVPIAPPLVVAVAAAAELGDISTLGRLAHVANVDFRRSGRAGTVAALVYLGAAVGRIPRDELLAAVDPVPGFDLTLAFTDSDPRGRRLREEDAVEVAALFLDTLLTSGALRGRVASVARGRDGVVGFGIRRVDLDETPLRRLVERRLRMQARAILFPPSRAAPAMDGSQVPVPPGVASLEAIHRLADGSYRPAVAALSSSADRAAELWVESRLQESADSTRDALLALIPPPGPPPRPGCWARWRVWLRKVLRGLRGRRPPGTVEVAHTTRRPAHAVTSSAARQAELVAAERNRLQLLRLAKALGPSTGRSPGADGPFEWSLASVDEIQEVAVTRCAVGRPELERVLAEAFPPSVVLAAADSPAALRSRFDLVCERVMQLGQRPRILRLDDYRTVLDRAAEAAEPLLCGGGPLARLALIPPRLAAAYAPAGHEVLEGREEEAVFVALHAGASLRSLSTGEGDIAL